jgi:heterogeneous nuclear ribonucleoprotein U-like protein 1
LGTDFIIDKMRVMGLPRKKNFAGRWDVLIKQSSDCFNALLKKASNLPRNLILDQTNVYASARRRKVKQYRDKGYIVNAMVLVPRDEDMQRRSLQRTQEEGKEVPESAVLDMKANFSLPNEAEALFDNITFLELQKDEAQKLVVQYNNEAMAKGHRSNAQKRDGRNQSQVERNKRDNYAVNKADGKPPEQKYPKYDNYGAPAGGYGAAGNHTHQQVLRNCHISDTSAQVACHLLC